MSRIQAMLREYIRAPEKGLIVSLFFKRFDWSLSERGIDTQLRPVNWPQILQRGFAVQGSFHTGSSHSKHSPLQSPIFIYLPRSEQ